MADTGEVLATGGMAIVAGTVGSALTYWFGVLNRRHQEAREKDTRWYEARFNAYVELSRGIFDVQLLNILDVPREDRQQFLRRLTGALGAIRLVGSPETSDAAQDLFDEIMEHLGAEEYDEARLEEVVTKFKAVARKDLGHEGYAQRYEALVGKSAWLIGLTWREGA